MTTRPDTLQGSLPLLVLNVLARRGPLHGYAITSRIHELSDDLRVEEGSFDVVPYEAGDIGSGLRTIIERLRQSQPEMGG